MNFAQAAHVCDLGEGFQSQSGVAVQAGQAESPHGFCTICASAHSPSLAVVLASLPPMGGSIEPLSPGRVIKRSALPLVAFHIRPPPIFV
jgi:hypothetical protein